ncbi:MAG TPA: hypothetical protein EYP85_05305 [Armatimonadetes bacterium]|nr:hypothetical protein [Armatimonadota bacterium]
MSTSLQASLMRELAALDAQLVATARQEIWEAARVMDVREPAWKLTKEAQRYGLQHVQTTRCYVPPDAPEASRLELDVREHQGLLVVIYYYPQLPYGTPAELACYREYCLLERAVQQANAFLQTAG